MTHQDMPNDETKAQALPPGSIIGMLGGGQLGRMAAMAAAELGYRVHVYETFKDSPCAEVSAFQTVGAWDDWDTLAAFAAHVDVITLEWENIPLQTVNFLNKLKPVRPNVQALAITQDRIEEKQFAHSLEIETAPFEQVTSLTELTEAILRIGTPALLKSTRLGYDGKGQAFIKSADPESLKQAWQQMGADVGILEGFVSFTDELSLMVARDIKGQVQTYPLVQNHHENQILSKTVAPAPFAAERLEKLQQQADAIAVKVAEKLDYVGVLAIEFFVAKGDRLLINEFAPRPHNSGHWTIEGCQHSQFEQQIRATVGLEVVAPIVKAPCVMHNLIGGNANDWLAWLDDPTAKLHLYGKAESREGRKMGHVTCLKSSA